MTDLRQSKNFASYMEKIGWSADYFKNENITFRFYLKKIPFLRNFLKILRPDKSPMKQIDRLAKKYRAFAVQINYSPTKTLQLNLDLPLEKIYQQMSKEARYEIRKAKANKIKITNSSDIDLFADFWQKNALSRGFWLPFKKEIRSLYEAFHKNKENNQEAYLLFAHCYHDLNHSIKPIAGVLIIIHEKTASYFHAFSSPLGRKLKAPSLLIWESLKLAKEKHCRLFDFEGIYDERFPNKSWLGFTHFKKSFGGWEVEFPETYTKFYNPLLKLLPGFTD